MSQTQTEVGVGVNMMHHWCYYVLINAYHTTCAILMFTIPYLDSSHLLPLPTLPPSAMHLPLHLLDPCCVHSKQPKLWWHSWSGQHLPTQCYHSTPGQAPHSATPTSWVCFVHVSHICCVCVCVCVCVCMCHGCVVHMCVWYVNMHVMCMYRCI